MFRGMTYAHEHLRLDLSVGKGDADCLLDEYDHIRDELRGLSARGVSRIVDLSCRGMGRDYGYLDRLATETGLRVLVSTGFYKEPFLPPLALEADERTLAALFVSDIRNGCEGSGRRAALIGEIGSGLNAMSPAERRVFAAAARAHAETGVPISTHTTLGTYGLEQAKLLKAAGVDPAKLVIGHLDLANDLDLIFRVLDEGAYVEFDTVGKTKYLPDSARAEFIAACCSRGYRKQLLLSMDITRRSHLSANGGPGYSHLLDSFLPLLRARGVSDAHLDDLMVANPNTLFGS